MLAEQITLQHSIEVEESAKPRFTREYILKYAQIVMYPTNRAPRACVQMVNPNIKDISCMFIVPVVHEDKTTTMTSLLWDDIEPIHLEPEEILDTVVRKPSKFVIKKLDSLLGCKSEEQSSDLYVITNREKRFGASCATLLSTSSNVGASSTSRLKLHFSMPACTENQTDV